MLSKKVLSYEAPHPGRHQEAYFAVDESQTIVCFSWKSGYASPINQAEEIINGICKLERLNWRNVTFYEIMLREYYRWLPNIPKICGYKLMRLWLRPDSSDPLMPYVDKWTWKTKNRDIPEDLLALFVEIDPYYPWQDDEKRRYFEDDPTRRENHWELLDLLTE